MAVSAPPNVDSLLEAASVNSAVCTPFEFTSNRMFLLFVVSWTTATEAPLASNIRSLPIVAPPPKVNAPVVVCGVSLSKNWLAEYPPNVLAPVVAPVNCAPVSVAWLIKLSPGISVLNPGIDV